MGHPDIDLTPEGDDMPLPPHWQLYPPWMDAPYIARTQSVRSAVVSIPGAGVTQLLGVNARRVALGVAWPSMTPVSIVVSPLPQPASRGWTLTGLTSVQWWWLLQHGALVTGEWYVQTDGAADLTVFEVELF